MNFLSHFYFESFNTDENMVMGVVLPDLVKNAQKDWNLYPLKDKHVFEADLMQHSILKGWEKHVAVDGVFHSSEFFRTQTSALKQILLPVLVGSPVKPFFLAHIGLELILDHLLVLNGSINIHNFYEQLHQSDRPAIKSFLENCGVQDTRLFFKFLDGFISSRYLLSYQKLENISYALNRICMRLWDDPLSETQLSSLTDKLLIFRESISGSYISIFDDIESFLNSGKLY